MPFQVNNITLVQVRDAFVANRDYFAPWFYNVVTEIIGLSIERHENENGMVQSLTWLLEKTISGEMSILDMKNAFFIKIEAYDNHDEYKNKIEQAFQNVYGLLQPVG